MSIKCNQILNNFPQLLEFISGSKETVINEVSGADQPLPGTLVFVNEANSLEAVLQSSANALVISPNLKEKALGTQKTLLVSPNPTLVMALTIDAFFSEKNWKPQGIHPTAVIEATAFVAQNTHIGAHCYVGSNSKIGEGTVIFPNTTIADNVSIGTDCRIFSNVTIEHKTQIGNRVEIKSGAVIGSSGFGFAPDHKGQFHRIPQRGIVVLEDDVSIGANTCVDRATFSETRIHQGTKLDNLIQVAHNCELGRHSVYAGGTVIAGSSKVGNHVMVGGQSAIGGHLTVCDKVQIGGRSAFSTDITKPGAYSGRPLLPIKDYLKNQILQTRLTSLFKDVSKIKKHLGLENKETNE